ncbi:MAG: exo-alpha-sialidase [Armatimonadetes bacterium]|nr:exo-alpha-sialidase [Armatimonadota bacterium]
MARLEIIDTGVVVRNPRPHLRSEHAYFPWLAQLPGDELLCSYQMGSAFEAADAHCRLARSMDLGRTWELEGRLYPGTGPDKPTSDCLKVTASPDGRMIAFGTRFDRSDPEAAIANEETGGLLPMEVVQAFSSDGGRTWSDIEVVPTPIPGPFEAQAPVVILSDGRWIVPMSTWMAWDGSLPNGDMCIALISSDQGRTWSQMATVFRDPHQRLVFWEVRIAELEPGRLLAVAWAHDKLQGRDIPNQYALSEDGGYSWQPCKPTGFNGQSCCPAVLEPDRVVFTYNYRYDEPGVRARLARLVGETWETEDEIVLWGVGAAASGAARQDEKIMIHEMSSFKFGQPSPHLLHDGTLITVHWCVVDCVSEIRWNRLRVV